MPDRITDYGEIMLGIAFRAAFVAFVLSVTSSLVIAGSDEPITFKGKTINLIVYARPGGAADVQGRLVARHISKYLPGNPNIVVQNVPGGGGLKAIRYLLEINPDTDLSFAILSGWLPFRSRSGQVSESVFDPRKMQWIGNASDSTNYCAFAVGAYDNLDELSEKEVTMGTLERSAGAYAVTQIVSEALDWKPKIVTGYQNVQSRALAIERGEIDGTCGTMASYPTSVGPLVERGIAKLALYMGPRRRDDIHAPYLLDLPMSQEKREFTASALSSISLGRPYALHPDADPRLLPLFRRAFEGTIKDPDFLAEARQANVDIEFTSGEEVEQSVKELYEMSDQLVSSIKSLLYE